MGSATISRSDVLQPSISFLDTVTAAATVTVSGCSGGTSVYATVTLKIVAKYYDANNNHITGADKNKALGVRSGSGTGSAYAVYQEANYNAGLWVAGNRPSGAVKAKYHYQSHVGGSSPCPATFSETANGPESDWVEW